MGRNSHVLKFSQIDRFDLDLVGKKAYEISELKHLGIPIPDGFVVLPFSDLSENLIREIHSAYRKISGVFKETSLNIFTSPVSNAKSIIFKNVKGDANILMKIKEIAKLGKSIAIVVQRNIQSKTYGTIITYRPKEKFKNLAKKIQEYFYFPQEVDYVVHKGKIYITNIKPFTNTYIANINMTYKLQNGDVIRFNMIT